MNQDKMNEEKQIEELAKLISRSVQLWGCDFKLAHELAKYLVSRGYRTPDVEKSNEPETPIGYCVTNIEKDQESVLMSKKYYEELQSKLSESEKQITSLQTKLQKAEAELDQYKFCQCPTPGILDQPWCCICGKEPKAGEYNSETEERITNLNKIAGGGGRERKHEERITMSSDYTDYQMKYICSVDGKAHKSAIDIIGDLEKQLMEKFTKISSEHGAGNATKWIVSDVKDFDRALNKSPDVERRIKELEALVYRIPPDTHDDGYGGKCEAETWKEAFEEIERYETWADKEMKRACDLIKTDPEWKYGENAFPSPHEKVIIAGCTRAVIDLKEQLTDLQTKLQEAKEELNNTRIDLMQANDTLGSRSEHRTVTDGDV